MAYPEKDVQLTTNFKLSEFRCKCQPFCGHDRINPKIPIMCQEIRDYIGEPLTINSGCRCPKRNAEAGSSSKNHINGNAADLSCKMGHHKLFEKIKELHAAGGVKDLLFCYKESTWIHIDCDRPRTAIFQVQK